MTDNNNYLNPLLDTPSLKQMLAEKTRLVIPHFFQDDYAERIFHCLSNDVPWQIAFRDEEKNQVLERQQLEMMTPQQRAHLNQQIVEMAKHRYQFMYNRYPMVESVLAGKNPGLFLNEVVEYINSRGYIEFLQNLTGDSEIRKCSAQATWYAPGNFLNYHTDVNPDNEDRRFAYVLNFSKDWRVDWGGLLQFVDQENNQIIDTFSPQFNALSIFKVPQGHTVSYVAPYAMKPRFSITGWLRAD